MGEKGGWERGRKMEVGKDALDEREEEREREGVSFPAQMADICTVDTCLSVRGGMLHHSVSSCGTYTSMPFLKSQLIFIAFCLHLTCKTGGYDHKKILYDMMASMRGM